MEVLSQLNAFGEALRKIRETRGLNVNQLAMYSHVSASLISQIENGKRGIPKPDTIEKLAKGLKIDYKYLMTLAGHLTEEAQNNKAQNEEETDIEGYLLLQRMKHDLKESNISEDEKEKIKHELLEWSELLELDDFMKKIDMSDENLLQNYKFTYNGKPLSDAKVQKILSFIRFVAQDE